MKISKNKLNLALARKQWNQRDLRDNAVVSSQTTLNINKGKEVMPPLLAESPQPWAWM